MKNTKTSLSDKIFTLCNLKESGPLFKEYDSVGGAQFLYPKDVKQFIKELKEEIKKDGVILPRCATFTFKLIDKKEKGVMPLDEVYGEVKKQALENKRNRELDKYLIQFSKKYSLELYPAVYDTIQTHDLSMLVVKRHYPNRLYAPPVTPLFKSFRWQNKMDKVFPKQAQ